MAKDNETTKFIFSVDIRFHASCLMPLVSNSYSTNCFIRHTPPYFVITLKLVTL
ncbi:hypothetical protein SR02_002521 [Salmonella enterica subsp. arizonae]|nr:hypothetical protein [Salmonella enterica subsp. arizonae]EDX5690854.1 hypothetical protein [Salmonella enterica subsp. arizonae]